MKKLLAINIIAGIVIFFSAFITILPGPSPVPVPPSKQRTNGDAKAGLEYLVNGDYVKGGIPYKLYIDRAGIDKYNYLQRTGLNKALPHEFNAIKAPNGQVLAAPNCLQCHAQVFEGQFVMGLGNASMDFSIDVKEKTRQVNKAIFFLKFFQSKQYEAAKDFFNVSKTIGLYLQTKVQGVNAADRLAGVLAAHRDPVTFKWLQQPALDIPEQMIPTDTPPWWLLKKKNAMFYNGFGRGDFGRFLMASNLLTVTDTSESAEVDKHMPDLLAYINSIEPPAYPKEIDQALAKKGKQVFENTCSGCHGHYGENESYPNLLIPSDIILTDSLLFKSNYSNPQFVNWFNKSWFTQGDHPARLVPFNGYLAPPLDGIWVTAPYLHNGSVPTLQALLNSKERPAYWSRNFEKPQYDYKQVGWVYNMLKEPQPKTYNTDLPGYGHYGHYFGDKLTDNERKAVIEYLKTL